MLISIIAAMGKNRVIGRDGTLPWRIPSDLQRFREQTTGHVVIMGRKTHESIGKPLPDRTNLVVTKRADYCSPGCTIVRSLEEALEVSRGETEVFICGGEELFREALPRAGRLYLTLLEEDVEGDTFFPVFPEAEFRVISRELISMEPHAVFTVLERADFLD